MSQDLEKLKAKIKVAYDKINRAKDRRSSANDSIAAVRSELEEAGIPRKALAAALSYCSMDVEAREGFDLAYAVIREALDLPVNDQGSIIDYIAEKKQSEEGVNKAVPALAS